MQGVAHDQQLPLTKRGAEGGRADAGRRALREPLKRAAVRWIQEQAEAGQQVFDFLPPEEIELLDGERVDPLLGESAGDCLRELVGAGEDADPSEVIGVGMLSMRVAIQSASAVEFSA